MAPASCCCSRWGGCPSAAASIEAIYCSCSRHQASTSCYSDVVIAAVMRQAEAVERRRSTATTRPGRSCCTSCLSSYASDGKLVYGCPDQALTTALAVTIRAAARGRAADFATPSAKVAY